ncbi:MAG: helix-turn-helix domain-containing protein [Lachnospirales bacterium]
MENILENGYSTFSQKVIKDTNLNIKSKGIYLFLCAYKNVDYIATPKRETIMNYLKIGSKNTYYKYIKELDDKGYISTNLLKVDGRFFCNQFIINKKVNNIELFDNYGIIPRKLMNDKNINIESKVIYSYLNMYRNKKHEVAFPNLSQIKSYLLIGINKISEVLKSLVENNYISKKQYRNENKFSSNIYHMLGYRENIAVKESTILADEIAKNTQ